MKLLSVSSDAKTRKGEKRGYLTGVLYLAPSRVANRKFNVCPRASAACRAACLYTAGRGRFSNVQESRVRKTLRLLRDRPQFISDLCNDIQALTRKAVSKNMTPVVRLNGTSDLPWESEEFGAIPQRFSHLCFYDYCKDIDRVLSNTPDNYHLTFSRTESNESDCLRALDAGHNVAVVFEKVPVGREWWGYTIVNGDEDDLRFLDEEEVIVGLKAKGAAKQDKTGFVVRPGEEDHNGR
jgi:hypothetical protein